MGRPSIKYQDVSPTAKLYGTPTASEKESYVDLNDLNLEFLSVPYYTTLERNDWALDGGHALFPNSPSTVHWGYVSEQISDENGEFETNPYINITFSALQSSVALTFDFDLNRSEWCDVKITYLRDGVVKHEQTYTPNEATYCCFSTVRLYNEVQIEFLKTSKPYRRARIAVIYYGIIRNFGEEELSECTALEEINPISSELSINTMTFRVKNTSNIDFLFQKMQPVHLKYDEMAIGTYFIEKATRTGTNNWTIDCKDSVGVLDYYSYKGAMLTNKNVGALIDEVLAQINVPYEYDSAFNGMTVSGYLPRASLRETLLQIAFVCNAIVDDARGSLIRFMQAPSNEPIQFDNETVHMDGNTTVEQRVTAVEVTAYSYSLSADSHELFNASLPAGTHEIKLDRPHGNYSITGGTITDSSVSYVKFTVASTQTVTITGKEYVESQIVYTKKNPDMETFDLDNVKSVSGCYLVNTSNAQAILERVYNYLVSTEKLSAKMILGSAKVGDIVEVPTDYGERKIGRIVKNTLSFGSKLRGAVEIHVDSTNNG